MNTFIRLPNKTRFIAHCGTASKRNYTILRNTVSPLKSSKVVETKGEYFCTRKHALRSQLFHSTSHAMSSKRDYYDVLGANRNDTKSELKKKYFKLAKKYHPDSNPDDESAKENFQEVSEAYEILSDDEKRAAYDQFGHAGVDGAAGGQGGFHGMSPEDIFAQAFGNMFGGGFGGFPGAGGPGGRYSNRGADLQMSVSLSFMEAVKGCHKEIQYRANTSCNSCKGTGAKDAKPETEKCSTCGGSGVVTQVVNGMYRMQTTCGTCQGQGEKLLNKCGSCAGAGIISDIRSHGIDIPAGVDNGQTMRIAGGGHDGENGGPAGSLYLEILVKSDPYFVRDHADVHTEIPISLSQALLGGVVPVATLDGEVDLKVKPGTEHGNVVRLPNRGIKETNKPHRGDQYVRYKVAFPQDLTDKQKQLIEEFEEIEQGKEDSCQKSSMKGVKDALNRLKSFMGSETKE